MKRPSNPLNNYAKYSSIALQMLVIIAGGVVGGYYLDKWIATIPIFTILFSFLSVSLAIYISIKDFLKK
jgi:F0F1-type ATP synthase assembly protein I